jgi:hypothetical protein
VAKRPSARATLAPLAAAAAASPPASNWQWILNHAPGTRKSRKDYATGRDNVHDLVRGSNEAIPARAALAVTCWVAALRWVCACGAGADAGAWNRGTGADAASSVGHKSTGCADGGAGCAPAAAAAAAAPAASAAAAPPAGCTLGRWTAGLGGVVASPLAALPMLLTLLATGALPAGAAGGARMPASCCGVSRGCRGLPAAAKAASGGGGGPTAGCCPFAAGCGSFAATGEPASSLGKKCENADST